MPFTPYNATHGNCRCLPFDKDESAFTSNGYKGGPHFLKQLNVSVIFRQCAQICAIGLISISLLVLVLVMIEWIDSKYALTFSKLRSFSYATYLLFVAMTCAFGCGVVMYNLSNRKCLITLTAVLTASLVMLIASLFASSYNARHLVESMRDGSSRGFTKSLTTSYNNKEHQRKWREAQTHFNCCGMRSAVQYYEEYTETCRKTAAEQDSVEQSFCRHFPVNGYEQRLANESRIYLFFEKAKLLQNCATGDHRLGCIDTILDRLQNHVKRIRFFTCLALPNVLVCLLTVLMFFMGEPNPPEVSTEENMVI